jgi:hypothetical protein
MKLRKLRIRVAVASSLGVAALAGGLLMSGGVASATVPAYPSVGTYPQWYTADNSVSHIIRGAGSDTTFFMQQSLSDLFNASGLNGCTLNADNAHCNTTGNVDTTDPADNFNMTEVLQGVNAVGSGNGQQQLCNFLATPQNVDYARSSKPVASNAGCTNQSTLIPTGYAKDSVQVVDWQNINPAAVGTATGYIGQTFTGVSFPSTGIGPVAAGWLPGDPTNCVAAGTGSPACSGTAFTDIDGSATSGAQPNSVPYRLWCQTRLTASGGFLPRITDWGQLTNLSAANNGGTAQAVGNGAPIGVPIRIIGVNKGSGTVATWFSFANSGETTVGDPQDVCTGSPFNPNAASGTNPLVNDGYTPGGGINHEIALENNASQVGVIALANWPNDPADQAVDIATSLYFMSNGVYNSNPNAPVSQLTPGTGTVPAGVPTAYTASQLNGNGVQPSILAERLNQFPTSRTLFNIYRNDNIKAAAGGYLNWQCSTAGDGSWTKGLNQISGNNFDQDITNTINGTYGFSRLTDTTPELSAAVITPADNLIAPNSECAAQISFTENGSTTLTLNTGTAYSTLPTSIQPGWSVTGAGIPAGTVIAAGGVGSTTLTLNHAATQGTVGSPVAATIIFSGHPPVLAVASPND